MNIKCGKDCHEIQLSPIQTDRRTKCLLILLQMLSIKKHEKFFLHLFLMDFA